jgi:chitinase
VTVKYVTGALGDTAVSPADYRHKTGTLTFLTKQRFKMVSVLVWPDSQIDGDETFTLTLSDPTGATIAMTAGTATIIDDDPSVGKRAGIGDSVTPEACAGNKTHASTVVTLSGLNNEPATFNVKTGPAPSSSATAGIDYAAVNRNITFFSGQPIKDIRIPIFADQTLEGSEQFTVTLTYVSGSVEVGRSVAIVSILDCQPT